ncbi:hypothetical protein DPMN_171665 [Dreissena polymorpha]|uniref:Uncharacterized protein n=1 Tax=Dreissena polymorpha TaxID=45954 RepID=A0A9D4E0V0_DREPO|nr:hypothetical protein DPMN_171665 [Dreissena polymorpha]
MTTNIYEPMRDWLRRAIENYVELPTLSGANFAFARTVSEPVPNHDQFRHTSKL